MDGEAVVLADEQDRQLMQRREVEGFVKHPFLGGTVAEKARGDAALAFAFQREGIARRHRDRGTDDGRHAEHVGVHVDQVHGSGLAGGAAGALAVKLRHHLFEVSALGQIGGVAPVGGRNHVARVEDVANADGHRFLADGQVHRTFDLVGRINAGDFFFRPPDQAKRTVYPGYRLRVGRNVAAHEFPLRALVRGTGSDNTRPWKLQHFDIRRSG